MNIEIIEKRVGFLMDKYQSMPDPEALQERLVVVWTRQTLARLNTILNALVLGDANSLNLVVSLQRFLSEIWTLINGTSLSYTAIPDAEITDMLIQVACFASHKLFVNPLNLLIPTLSTDNRVDKLFESDSKVDIETIFHTHVLGEGGKSLLPIKLISSALFIDLVEPRILKHSILTRTLWIKNKVLDAVMFNGGLDHPSSKDHSNNLFVQLQWLCKGLSFNDAHGNSAMIPYSVIAFLNYFNRLDEREKQQIPPVLNDEINFLKELATHPEKSIHTTEHLATCITIHKNHLISGMIKQEMRLLRGIYLNKKKAHEWLCELEEEILLTQKELSEAIEFNHYREGRDQLGISIPLLDTLNVELRINSFKLSEIIKDTKDFNEVLQYLSCERIKIFLEMVKDKLPELIKSGCYLNHVMEKLSPEKWMIVFEAVKDKLPEIIKDGYDFGNMIKMLSSERSAIILKSLSCKWPSIIKNRAELVIFLIRCPLYDKSMMLLELLKDKLLEFIKDGEDLGYLMQEFYFHYRDYDKATIFFETFKDKLPEIIKNIDEFNRVKRVLTPKQQSLVLESVQWDTTQATHEPQQAEKVVNNQCSERFFKKAGEEKEPAIVESNAIKPCR